MKYIFIISLFFALSMDASAFQVTSSNNSQPNSGTQNERMYITQLTGNFGIYSSSIENFNDEYAIKPIYGGTFAVKLYKLLSLTYNYSYYASQKTSGNDGNIYNPVKLEKFNQLKANPGLRVTFKNLISSNNSYTWLGGGFSTFNIKESTIIDAPVKVKIVDGEITFIGGRSAIENKHNISGQYIEIGQMFSVSNAFNSSKFTIGFSISAKYDMVKLNSKDYGGFSISLGTNLLRF